MQAIVLTFERLATRLLGCYGNEWIETPHFDRLAATGTVFDNHFADSVGPRRGRAWLSGEHSLCQTAVLAPMPISALLRTPGMTSHLFVDPSTTVIPWESAGFDHTHRVAGHSGLNVAPTDVPIARLVQSATRVLAESPEGNRLIWIHAPEPGLPPEGFATLYAEDFEERGLKLEDVPRDEWAHQIAVAAGSVSLTDHWLGELVSKVNPSSQHQATLFLIAAAQGKSWTEQGFSMGRPGFPSEHLREMQTRSPLLMSVRGTERDAEFAGLRCRRFVQSTNLLPTLRHWFAAGEESATSCRSLLRQAIGESPALDDVAFSDDDRSFGLRTAHWNCLMRFADASRVPADTVCYGDSDWPFQVQLFSKPDDIWDVTDLSTQQPEVCEELVRQLCHKRRGD